MLAPILLGAALLATAHSAITAKLILAAKSTSWFGSSAIALQGPADPVFMTSTWVYEPTEIVGWRTSRNATAPAWVDDTSKDLHYQTLSVASPGVATVAGRVDSLAFWNRKPSGLNGECVLFGFNSARAPDLIFGPSTPSSWHVNLTEADCDNVNLAVPWSRFALSDNGALAAAFVQGADASVTLYVFDGATGAPRWTKHVPCGTPAECQYFLAYGVDVSADGRFVLFDDGVEGAGAHRLNVLDAADGTPRCDPVLSAGDIPAHASPNGDFMMTADDGSAASTGAFSTWRWDAAAKAYARVGGSTPPDGGDGSGWVLAQYAFSADAAGNTWLGVVWFASSLSGPSVFAIYNASAPTTAIASASRPPLAGSDMANAGAVVDCAGALCAAGLYTQEAGNAEQPTLIVLAGDSPSSNANFTTPGSVDAVSVASAGAPGKYYVLAAGCSSPSVCTKPGGNVRAYEITVSKELV